MKSKVYVLETLMGAENEVFIVRDDKGTLLYSCVNNSEEFIDFLRNPNPKNFDINE